MVSMLVYSSDAKELCNIKVSVKDLAAYLSEEKWETSCFSSLKEIEEFLENRPLVNMACYDVTKKGSLDLLGQVRKHYNDMLLMIIADDSLSPMEYVRPDILASSLIIRPFSRELLNDKLKDMIWKHLSQVEENNPQEAFIVDTKEGKTRVPYSQIYFMEARDKKIYIRLQNKEMAFNGTLDELEETLPGIFIRCHRSFLINQMHIEKIFLSQSEIRLSHGISVPLSRSYKSQFKAFR